MTLGQSIRSGTGWLITGNLSRRLIEFAFGVVLARLLVPADFGMLVTIQIFTGFAGLFAAGGMGQALIRAKAVEEADFNSVFTAQLLMGAVIYSIFFVIAPWFAESFGDPLYGDLLRVSALSFLIRPMANVATAKLSRQMLFRRLSLIGIAVLPVGGAASIIMAFNGMGPWSLILSSIFGTIVSNFILVEASGWRPRISMEVARVKQFASFGAKFMANGLLIYFKSQTGNFIITKTMGATPLGLYNKSMSLAEIPRQTIVGSLYQTIFRGLAKVQDNKDVTKYMYLRTIELITVYTLPIYVGMWWLAQPFILVVYGEKWLGAAEPLQVLALSGVLLIGNPSGALIAAHNKLGKEIWVNLETWLVLIGMCWFGSNWGIVGVAWSIVIHRIYNNLRMFMLARVRIDASYNDLTKALFPGYIMNFALWMALWAADASLNNLMGIASPVVYMLSMAAIGAVVYAFVFLILTPQSLRSEADKWKKFIFRREQPST